MGLTELTTPSGATGGLLWAPMLTMLTAKRSSVSLGGFVDFDPVVLTRRADRNWQGDAAIEGLGDVYQILGS